MSESIRGTLGFRPFLRPCRKIDTDAIRRVGRIPVELDHAASAATKVWHPLKWFLLRPSSPKPTFAIQDFRCDRAPQGLTGQGGFDLGGFVLAVEVSAQESVRHLQRSLRSGPFRSARVVVVCTPEEYLSPYVTYDCYCVDTEAARRPGHGPHDLRVPSSVEDRLGAERTRRLTRDELPSDAVWLVCVQASSDANPHQSTSTNGGSRFFDPVRLRSFRYAGYATAPLTLAGSLFAAWLETKDDFRDCALQPCEPVLGAWSVSLFAAFVLISVPFCGWHFIQWCRERRWNGNKQWTSCATRCLDDGQVANSGYASKIMRELREGKEPQETQKQSESSDVPA